LLDLSFAPNGGDFRLHGFAVDQHDRPSGRSPCGTVAAVVTHDARVDVRAVAYVKRTVSTSKNVNKEGIS
jgi:hypothetical protein